MTELFGLVLLGLGWLAGRFLEWKPRKKPSAPEGGNDQ